MQKISDLQAANDHLTRLNQQKDSEILDLTKKLAETQTKL